MRMYILFNLKSTEDPAAFESWIKQELPKAADVLKSSTPPAIHRINTVMQGSFSHSYIADIDLANEMSLMMIAISPSVQEFMRQFNARTENVTLMKSSTV